MFSTLLRISQKKKEAYQTSQNQATSIHGGRHGAPRNSLCHGGGRAQEFTQLINYAWTITFVTY
jgi:hypothetical protein